MSTPILSPAERRAFIDLMVRTCTPVAVKNNLPAAAMVACGIVESGFGASPIYRRTHCPFNLQKPKWYHWVHCFTVDMVTSTRTDDAGRNTTPMVAPFCYAMGDNAEDWLPDAARIWCEWILGWPQPGTRARLLGMKGNPVLFAQNLPLVGFGEAKKARANGAAFAAAVRDHQLVRECLLAATQMA